MKKIYKIVQIFFVIILMSVLFSVSLSAEGDTNTLPDNTVDTLFTDDLASVITGAENETTSQSLQLLILLTVLAILPSIILMMTSFTRITIVFSFVRSGIGLQQTPPNQVLIGLALFLSLFIMMPTFNEINEKAYIPYSQGEITQQEAFDEGMKPLRKFMMKQTDSSEMNMFLSLSGKESVEEYNDIPTESLIPAFILSELKKAFIMGFMILIPFLIIDLVVSSTLMSMGMIMVPPSTIALPFKLILFVVVNGWDLVVKSLVTSFS